MLFLLLSDKHGLAAGAHGDLADVDAPGLVHDVDDVVGQDFGAEVEAVDVLAVVAARCTEAGEGVYQLAVDAGEAGVVVHLGGDETGVGNGGRLNNGELYLA